MIAGTTANTSRKNTYRRRPAALIAPGTAEVTADGVLHLAAADLDYAGIGDRCTLSIHAARRTVSVRTGTRHTVAPGPMRGLIPARRELDALGVRLHPDKIDKLTVVRHTDGASRWLELRFTPARRAAKHAKRGGDS